MRIILAELWKVLKLKRSIKFGYGLGVVNFKSDVEKSTCNRRQETPAEYVFFPFRVRIMVFNPLEKLKLSATVGTLTKNSSFANFQKKKKNNFPAGEFLVLSH